jgi:DNA-directed RNA polymerase subunit N (RpoN/RPB10)
LCIDADSEYDDWIENAAHTCLVEVRCAECGRVIPPGAPHFYGAGVSIIWDDDGNETEDSEISNETHQCLLCHAVVDSVFSCGWHLGMVWSDLRDYIFDNDPEAIDEDDSWLDPPTRPIGKNGW